MNSKTSGNGILFGIILCVLIAMFSYVSWSFYKPISGPMWAFIFSILIANTISIPKKFSLGIQFSSNKLLKGTIASLGLVTSASIWLAVGVGVISALVVIFFSLFFSFWLGKKLGLSKNLSALIGVGTSICGASAIAAVGPALNAKKEEMGIALTSITLFGLLAMFTYPFLFTNTIVGEWLNHNLTSYSIWVGSGVHETAQVAAAAAFLSPDLVGPALLIKSVRIFMIGPIILLTTYIINRKTKTISNNTKKFIFPYFGLVFIFLSFISFLFDSFLVNSFIISSWVNIKGLLGTIIIPFLLSVAFAGIGCNVKIREFRKLGFKPLVIGGVIAMLAGLIALIVTIAVTSLV